MNTILCSTRLFAAICSVCMGLPQETWGFSPSDARNEVSTNDQQLAQDHYQNAMEPSPELAREHITDNTPGRTESGIRETYDDVFARGTYFLLLGAAAIGLLLAALAKLATGFFERCGGILAEGSHRVCQTLFTGQRDTERYLRYVASLGDAVVLPFAGNRTDAIEALHVPVPLQSGKHRHLSDVDQLLRVNNRTLVRGGAGSGKSWLLRLVRRRLAVAGIVARNSWIPIYLELWRCNRMTTLTDELIESLARNNVRYPGRFLNRVIRSGRAFFLFDGLDEVNATLRKHVAAQIQQLLDETCRNWLGASTCNALVSCRDTVALSHFGQNFDEVSVLPYRDCDLINLFRKWEENSWPDGVTASVMLSELGNAPTIKELAKNPLMATVLAYLRTKDDFRLPSTRAEFYNDAVDILMTESYRTLTLIDRTELDRRRALLQSIAAKQLQRYCESRTNLRTIDEATINAVPLVPDWTTDDRTRAFREIIDAGTLLERQRPPVPGYTFTHHSFQDFLAAESLGTKGRKVIDRFDRDQEVLRDTLRMTCGLVDDATDIVKQVWSISRSAALECLVDARYVDLECGMNIVRHFWDESCREGEQAIIDHLGAIASKTRT
jgi:hypothetical protein